MPSAATVRGISALINEANLQVNSAGLFGGGVSASATANLNHANAVLDVAGSTTNARNLINNGRILDGTDSGMVVSWTNTSRELPPFLSLS